MANDNYLISVNDVYLTSDGTEDGIVCKSRVEGVGRLQLDYDELIRRDFHGNPIKQQTNVGVKGKPIAITEIYRLPNTVINDLITELRDSQLNKTPLNLVGTHATALGFSLTVLLDETATNPFELQEFTGFGHYINSTLRFVATGTYVPPP